MREWGREILRDLTDGALAKEALKHAPAESPPPRQRAVKHHEQQAPGDSRSGRSRPQEAAAAVARNGAATSRTPTTKPLTPPQGASFFRLFVGTVTSRTLTTKQLAPPQGAGFSRSPTDVAAAAARNQPFLSIRPLVFGSRTSAATNRRRLRPHWHPWSSPAKDQLGTNPKSITNSLPI
uniref:Uncharacterized protein n=1 Tax=Oryza meridionalis TaxID=40149 RepID=A0A0E0DAE5_9ORYZ